MKHSHFLEVLDLLPSVFFIVPVLEHKLTAAFKSEPSYTKPKKSGL